jgi:hypothetical protein
MKINKGSPLKIIFLTLIVLAGVYFFLQSTIEGMRTRNINRNIKKKKNMNNPKNKNKNKNIKKMKLK